jgi:nicotinate-nucleotide pyrophosphorylase (carboxylating)
MPVTTFDDVARRNAETLLELALAEDLGTAELSLRCNVEAGRIDLTAAGRPEPPGDVTSLATIPAEARAAARFVARSAGVVAGMPVLELVMRRFGPGTFYRPEVEDGAAVERGTVLAHVSGPARELLAAERSALNFLQRLSGIATLTARFVAAVAGTRAAILDTRKTAPGWRALEKYAVRCGGGRNHRFGLFDAVLVKDNHLAWLRKMGETDPIGRAIERARREAPQAAFVEMEVDSLDALDRALECRPDIVLIDNFDLADMAEAVRRRDARAPGVLIEASGGIRLETVAAIARTGVDRISVGALTHSAPALDIALDFEADEQP